MLSPAELVLGHGVAVWRAALVDCEAGGNLLLFSDNSGDSADAAIFQLAHGRVP